MLTIFLFAFLFIPKAVFAQNLVLNSGFETAGEGLENWSKYGGILEATRSPVLSGSGAAKFTSNTTSNKYLYQTVPATAGASYKFSAHVLKSDANSSVYLRISWYESNDGTGTAISNNDSDSLSAATTAFHEISLLSITAPANALSAKLKLMLDPPSALATTIYFDDITFELSFLETKPPQNPLTISFSTPTTAEINAPFDILVNLQGASPEASYYIKSLVNNYGYTFNQTSSRWLAWNASWQDFPIIKTSATGSATFIFKARSPQDAPEGGNQIFIRLRQIDTTSNLDSPTQNIILTKPVIQSTSSAQLTISLFSPTSATIGAEFAVEISIINADPLTDYWTKLRIGLSPDKLTRGQTFNENNLTPDDWLSDSDNWSKFPILTTDSNGQWSGKLKAKISDSADPGNYILEMRIRKANGTINFDSNPYTIIATSAPEEAQEENVLGAAITSITFIRNQPDETVVSVEGIVTAPPNLLGKGVFYIQDETSGIMVKLPSPKSINLNLGDRVRVGCSVKTTRGERYIDVDKNSEVFVLVRAVPPQPKEIKTRQIQENYEGQLVKIKGKVVETKGDIFYLDDGSGEAKVYIKDSTGIDKPKMKKGEIIEVTGLVSQYETKNDPGYRLLPRYQSDIKILPVTGASLPIGIPLIFLGLILKKSRQKHLNKL